MRQDNVPNHHQCPGKNTQQVTDSVSNQTITRAGFVAISLVKGLTDSVMPTGRNSGSSLTLYGSTIMFALRKAGQVSRKRLQPMILIFSLVVLTAESLEM